MPKRSKQVIQEILDCLPYFQRKKVEEAGRKYRKEKREELTPAVVERLYLQVLAEAKERGK